MQDSLWQKVAAAS